MNKKRAIIVSLIIMVVLFLIIFSVIKIKKIKNNIKNNNTKVSLYTVNGPQKVFFEGEIKSSKSIVLQSDSTKGIVDKINVKDKQKVKTGDILFSYKNNQFIEQKNDVEFELENLKNKYNKTKKELDSVSHRVTKVKEQEIQKQRNEEQTVLAEKSKTELKNELNYNIKHQNRLNEKIKNISDKCNVYIKAPFDGVITIGGYSEIDPSKPILTLNSENMHVVCRVSEKDIFKLTEDQIVKVSVLGTGQAINGKIKHIDKKPLSEVVIPKGAISQGAESQSSSNNISTVNSYEVILKIDDIKNIYPGFHVQVSTEAKNYILKVPKTSIFKNGGKNYIWVVKGGILKKKEIEVADWNDKYVHVKNGVNFNDKVVREAKVTMKEGDKID